MPSGAVVDHFPGPATGARAGVESPATPTPPEGPARGTPPPTGPRPAATRRPGRRAGQRTTRTAERREERLTSLSLPLCSRCSRRCSRRPSAVRQANSPGLVRPASHLFPSFPRSRRAAPEPACSSLVDAVLEAPRVRSHPSAPSGRRRQPGQPSALPAAAHRQREAHRPTGRFRSERRGARLQRARTGSATMAAPWRRRSR